MRKGAIWLCLSCIMVVALVLSACQPAPTTEPSEEGTRVVGEVTPGEEEEAQEEDKGIVEPSEEAKVVTEATTPKYGGTLTYALVSDIRGFDPNIVNVDAECLTLHITNEELMTGDWAKGPAGTGDVSWIMPGLFIPEHNRGAIAESWEMPDEQTLKYSIRRGIHWHDRAPAFGRELNAEDVAYSIHRKYLIPGTEVYENTVEEDRIISIETPDKWTVVVTVPAHTLGAYFQGIGAETWIFPVELGDANITSWEGAIGTGPYIITDHVIDSSVTLDRNPRYWAEDPVHPGNRLPYPDKVRQLVIEDQATRIAALQTGKIDRYRGLEWKDGERLMKGNPELNYIRYLTHVSPMIWMRMDKPELPFDDLRVRRALSMAIDRDAIIEGYFQGNAEKFCHPILPVPDMSDMFVPLKEQSAETQERYEHHPDKARELLAEAGYPNGFKTSIVTHKDYADMLSIVKQQWSEVGVELELDVRERGAWRSIMRGGGHEELLAAQITNIYYYRPLAYLEDYIPQYNRSFGVDEYVEEYFEEKLQPYIGVLTDDVLRANLRELAPYLCDLCWAIELPSQYYYTMWQPWVGGYHGEYSVGRGNHEDWPKYVWIDEDVKRQYTGR